MEGLPTIKREAEFLVCEECHQELEEIGGRQFRYYKEKYGCANCGRILCSNCDEAGNFSLSYRTRNIRLCHNCLGDMKVLDLIKKVKGERYQTGPVSHVTP